LGPIILWALTPHMRRYLEMGGNSKNHMVLARQHFCTLCYICTDYLYRIFLW
jgi:hypothetical protein